MQFLKNRSTMLIGIMLLIILSSVTLMPLFAQGNTTVLTIGIEEFQQNFINDEAFAAFEEAHPGVDVVPVILSSDSRFFGAPQDTEGVEEFLENTNALASEADLLPFDFFNNPRLRTRAGMYLDINPLLSADPDANIEDFYPAMFESMQWDGGVWGLPMSGSVQVVVYDQNAFDEAGLAYPDSSWTLDDFINAGEVLTEFNAEGNVTLPGFFGFDPSTLFASIITGDLSDPSAFPSRPLINTPEIVTFVEQWAAYQAEYSPDFSSGVDFDFEAIPLRITGTFALNDEFNIGPADANFQGALLPNNRAALQVQAYAVSAGTSHPELAYELLQYMSSTPEIAFAFFGDTPARQSLLTADTSDLPIFRPDNPEELQALIDDAIANAIPANRLAFFNYVSFAASRVNSEEEPVTADVALQDLQDEINEVFIAIEEAASTNVVAVATAIPTPVLQSGEVSLTFGIESNFGPSGNRDLWDAAIGDFVAQDSQVGQIVLNSEFMSLEERVEEQDCFYLSSNVVATANLAQFLSVDPFLSTDVNLDPNNFVNGTLNQVTRDNAIWGVPLSITPDVMWYNPELFAEAGLPEPSNDWTIFEFVDALMALDSVSENAPYQSQGFSGAYLYQLIAAYGGLPIDYSTTPYTVDVSSSTNVEAIRQVLQLAKDGLIDYQAVGNFGGGGFGGGTRALFDATLSPNDFRLQNRGEEFGDPSRVVMFPRGIDYIPLSYALGVGHISSNTPAPDACYRWLSFLARRGDVLQGMPAQVDLFDEAVAQIDEAEDVVALYQAYNDALQNPNVVIIPSPFGNSVADPAASVTNFITQNWLNRAFDNIVLEDADVDVALADATQFIDEFATCTSGIEPLDRPFAELSDEEAGDYFNQYLRCAVDVDPSMSEIFGGALEDDE